MMRKTQFGKKKDVYKGGAIRNSREGKGRFDLVTPFMLERLAKLYEVGAVAHGDNNWMNGVPFSRLLDSAMRHINQHRQGKRDEDHLTQAIWNLSALVHFEEVGRTDLDDLVIYPAKIRLDVDRRKKRRVPRKHRS